jgi:hypothetical protein
MTHYIKYDKNNDKVLTAEEVNRQDFDKRHHAFPYLFASYEKFANETEEKVPDKREIIDKMFIIKGAGCEYIYGFFFEQPKKMYYCLDNKDGILIFMEQREWATLAANALGMHTTRSKQDRVLEYIDDVYEKVISY